MATSADMYLAVASAQREDALAHATGGTDKTGGLVAMAILDTLLAQAYIMRSNSARSHRALSRLEDFLEHALPGVVAAVQPPSPVATDEVGFLIPAASLDELIGAASQAIVCLDPEHPARVRLAAALKDPGLGFTVTG